MVYLILVIFHLSVYLKIFDINNYSRCVFKWYFLLYFHKKNLKEILAYSGKISSIIVLSLLLVFLFYSFHVINSDIDGIKSQIQYIYSPKLPLYGKSLLLKMSEGNIFEKASVTYSMGLLMTTIRANAAGSSTYFLGKLYGLEGAGHWYFPVLYLTKLPLPFLIIEMLLLFIITKSIYKMILKIIRKEIYPNEIINKIKKLSFLSILLIFFIITYATIALNSRLNIGLRHFMPVVFASSLLVARCSQIHWNKKIFNNFKIKYIIFGLLIIMTISVFASFPYYLSYYNILGGGTDNGYKIATDSNYDWGQDVKKLGKWMKENEVEKIYVDIFSLNAPRYYLGDSYQEFNIKYDDLPPSGSYLAVSVMNYQNNTYDVSIASNKKYSNLKDSFVGKAGKSIFIFKIH